MDRLTEHNKTGWILKLEDPQNEVEARQQLMSKFKLACKKLGQLEDIMEKYSADNVEELEQKLDERDIWEKACELACREATDNHCPNMPEKFNLQEEYGSDEPYWVEEGGCEFPDHCLECCIDYFKHQAEKEIREIEKWKRK